MPKISVIIPTYNTAEYLPEAIQSVLSQTFQDWELWICDDGSTDGTEKKIASFLTDHRIHYERHDNWGRSKTVNVAIKKVLGEFVAFLDADDVWLPTKLEKQIQLFSNEQVGLVFTRRQDLTDDGVCHDVNMQVFRGTILKDLIATNFITNSSVIVRKDVFSKAGYLSEDKNIHGTDDYDLWLRVALYYDVDFVNEPLVRYRIHASQMTNVAVERMMKGPLFLFWKYLLDSSFVNYRIEILKGLLRALYIYSLFEAVRLFKGKEKHV